MRQAAILALIALSAAACSTEQRMTVGAADEACSRYGFTAASVDYVRCQEQVELARRSSRVAVDDTEAQLVAESDAACEAYGVPRRTSLFDRCMRDEFAARRPG